MFWSRKAEPQAPGFRGVWAAAVTPHRREGFEADHAAMLEIGGPAYPGRVSAALFCWAPRANSRTSKSEERQRLVHLAVKRSRVPIIAAVSHSTLDTAIQLADAAVESGAAGLLLMPPYFYRYGAAEILEFYRVFAVAVGGRGSHPALQYSGFYERHPHLRRKRVTGERGVSPVSRIPAGTRKLMNELAALHRDHRFSLLCGNDRQIMQARRAGYDGVVSGVACALPETGAGALACVGCRGRCARRGA